MEQKHPLQAYREGHTPPLSQTALAEQLRVTKASVSRWEAGKRVPRSAIVLRRIAEVTGIMPAEVVLAEVSLAESANQ